MRCPFCGHLETQVVETRDSDEGDSIRRRRKCGSCDKRFTTYERAEIELPAIVKRDGRRTDFDRSKLKGSMMLALRKRPVSAEALEGAIEAIEARLRQSGDKEVDSTQLGEWVMRELRKLDKVAYVRFASVYRSFDDVSEFVAAIKETGKAAAKKDGG
jgi:transcriptional repressor NrdR